MVKSKSQSKDEIFQEIYGFLGEKELPWLKRDKKNLAIAKDVLLDHDKMIEKHAENIEDPDKLIKKLFNKSKDPIKLWKEITYENFENKREEIKTGFLQKGASIFEDGPARKFLRDFLGVH